eukprot:5439727-Amphidinium_carterae.1
MHLGLATLFGSHSLTLCGLCSLNLQALEPRGLVQGLLIVPDNAIWRGKVLLPWSSCPHND